MSNFPEDAISIPSIIGTEKILAVRAGDGAMLELTPAQLKTYIGAGTDPGLSQAFNDYVIANNLAVGGKVAQSAFDTFVSTYNATVNGLQPKVDGKGLSTNDYTNAEKQAMSELSNFDPTQFANSPFFESINGMYYPVLTAEGLDNPTANATNGLANHPSGGVVAAVAGTAGSGNIYLPKPIDASKPFRVAILIEINDDLPITQLHFGDASDDFRTGIRGTNLRTSGIGATVGGDVLAALTAIPAGTKVWFMMTGDGKNVTSAIIPDVNPMGLYISTSSIVWDQRVLYKINPINALNSGIAIFGGAGTLARYKLTRLSIATQSTQNRIIGVFINQGLGNPSDGKLNPPGFFRTSILQDNSAIIFIPKVQGSRPVDLVMLNHQNAYGNLSNCTFGTGTAPTIMKLWEGGYCAFGIDGGYNAPTATATEATVSNWGAPTGMKYRKALLEYVRANIPATRYLNLLGFSMGFLVSLRYAIQYPNSVRSICAVSGVCDLSDCYTNRGFSGTIQKAFGDFYVSAANSTGVDPALSVRVTASQIAGVTSLPIGALTSAIPAGTTLILDTGTALQTAVVTTAAAAVNATTLSVQATIATMNTGATYGASAYWTKLTYGFGQPDEAYYSAPYIWKDTYVGATAYFVNDIVTKPSTSTLKSFYFVDPVRNVFVFLGIDMMVIQTEDDTLVPSLQVKAFKQAFESAGGSLSLTLLPTGGHLGASIFDPAATLAFFNSKNS